jgi:Ca2+-binding EF-hand superfamily protein
MRWTFAVGLMFVAAAAQAGDPRPAGKPGHPQIDANNDGMVTREEAQAFPRLTAEFDAADTNKDGQLGTTEMNAHREKMRVEMRAKAEQRWTEADKDGDGALTREEAQASMPGLAERFEQFDSNGDGKIARDEMHNVRMKKKR